MILVDTSAWVEEIRRTRSPAHLALTGLLKGGAAIAVTEPVVMELLAGARSTRELRALRARILSFPILRVDHLSTFERAAAVWRLCRVGGEPVRNTTDCLIAAVAIREDVPVLHADRDFETIARHTDLRIQPLHP